ncbi:MAG: tyrosine-type recombinase/integrase [Lachnospiraceae bacterium]
MSITKFKKYRRNFVRSGFTSIDHKNPPAENESDKLPDIPLHGLRHTSATLLISQNVDVKTVSNRLGHAQTSTLNNQSAFRFSLILQGLYTVR